MVLLDGLMYKIAKMGVDLRVWSLIRQLYDDLRCCVRIGYTISDYFNVYQGVHQGGVLSMTLYTIFNNDLIARA